MIAHKKIILLGPMGAGKSTLGKILSRELQWPYIDNDSDMALQTGITINQLSELSVPELHKIEADFIINVMKKEAPFISGAAASVIENENIRELLKEIYAVYLSIPVETAIARASAGTVGRQALNNEGIQLLRDRYARRDPLYRQVASLTLDLTDSPEKDAQKIISAITNDESA
jgi:shikimate kinase